jgi:pimeloyl-ACP methyl ester carboxylesterase
VIAGIAIGLFAACSPDSLVREERLIAGPDPSIKLFTMTVRSPTKRRGAVVFTHGAGSGGSASWDIRAGGASIMRFLACAGFDAYAFDARGFGGSTMPHEMAGPVDGTPIVRAKDAVLDLDRVVVHAMRTSSVAKVALVGWSWGSDVAGLYAGTHPAVIDRLVLMAPVYDRRWPARHVTTKVWYPLRREEVEKLYAPEREDRAVWDEFVASLFRFDKREVLRLPSGPYLDIYGDDAPIWDAHKIAAPVVVLRGDEDKASLEPNAYRLFLDLSAAPSRRYVVIGGVGHFLFRERKHAEVARAVLEAIGG